MRSNIGQCHHINALATHGPTYSTNISKVKPYRTYLQSDANLHKDKHKNNMQRIEMFCSLEEDVHVELEDVVHANIPYISMAIQAIHTYKAYLEFDIRFTHIAALH